MITLEPIGGLGNRMRAIDSALALADALARPLRVIWTRTDDCHCRFGAIFDPLPGATVVERGWWANRALRRFELWSGRHSREVRQRDLHRLRGADYDFRLLESERSVFIQTHDRFQPARERGFSIFAPTQPLRAEIDRLSSSFTESTIGVHIRRGDHDPSRRHSPTSAFVERISAEIACRPTARFFLATDAPDVEEELTRLFGNRIVTFRKPFDRTTEPGVQAAVVELFALARTNRLLGSFYSSFSETAAELGGIPLEIVTHQPRQATRHAPARIP